MVEINPEKDPGRIETKGEQSVPALGEDFEKSFAKGDVPPYNGEQFGVAHKGNEFYGEAKPDDTESENIDNEGVTNAASLINYGLDAVAREIGVEAVVQGIRSFDASKSDNPIRDLYIHLGIDTIEELNDTRDESQATKTYRERFRSEFNMPRSQQKTREGAIKAIQDMKELIIEVEGADPRYQELRDSAKTANKGYFEYAVKDFGLRGLTDLFSVLAQQREKKEQSTAPIAQAETASEDEPNDLILEQPEAETPEPENLVEEEKENDDDNQEDDENHRQEKDPRIVSGQ